MRIGKYEIRFQWPVTVRKPSAGIANPNYNQQSASNLNDYWAAHALQGAQPLPLWSDANSGVQQYDYGKFSNQAANK